jgi:hypothetical protein
MFFEKLHSKCMRAHVGYNQILTRCAMPHPPFLSSPFLQKTNSDFSAGNVILHHCKVNIINIYANRVSEGEIVNWTNSTVVFSPGEWASE